MNDWAHSPVHILGESGAYMVTAGTYKKHLLFNSDSKIQLLHDTLLSKADCFGWQLQAWAVFANHYHFVALAPDKPESLKKLIMSVHGTTSRALNLKDDVTGRKVWFQYWDSRISFTKSYFARLNYVHNNPVHHGLVKKSADYRWCSASWFSRTADPALKKTVAAFKTDRLEIPDDF